MSDGVGYPVFAQTPCSADVKASDIPQICEENGAREGVDESYPIAGRGWRREFAQPLEEDYCALLDTDFPI